MKIFSSWSELVSIIFKKDSQAVTLRPNQSTTYTASRDTQLPPGDAAHVLTSADSTQILTNKSINGSNNTITNVPLSTGVTGTLPLANGGTGQTAKAAAFDALSPMTAVGDIVVGGASGTGTRLGVGASGTVLKGGTTPAWASIVNADISSSAAIDYSKLADGSALSVLGRSANSSGENASIAAGTDGYVLRRSGTSLGFAFLGNANISAAAAIAGTKLVAAASGVAGAVSTSAQTFTGLKTLESGGLIAGITDGTDVAAGYVGEIITGTRLAASALSLTTATAAQPVAVQVTPGRWRISGFFGLSGTATSVTSIVAGIATGGAATPAVDNRLINLPTSFSVNASNWAMPIGPFYISRSGSNADVAINVTVAFSGGTCSTFGKLWAERIG